MTTHQTRSEEGRAVDDFGPAARYAAVDPLALDKVLVELSIVGVVLASAWRVAARVRRRAAPRRERSRTKDSGA